MEKTILLINPGPKGTVHFPKLKAGTMKHKTKRHKKGKMPPALAAYWAGKRKPKNNPKQHRKAARRKPMKHNPSKPKRIFGGVKKYLTMDLLKDAGLGVLGYGAARIMANGAAKILPTAPGSAEPFLLRFVGVVQFAAGAFVAVKAPKLRGLGIGLCVAGLQDGIRRNVPALAPMLGADDETLLAYSPAPFMHYPAAMGAPISLGADSLTDYQPLGAPVALGGNQPMNSDGFSPSDFGYSY